MPDERIHGRELQRNLSRRIPISIRDGSHDHAPWPWHGIGTIGSINGSIAAKIRLAWHWYVGSINGWIAAKIRLAVESSLLLIEVISFHGQTLCMV